MARLSMDNFLETSHSGVGRNILLDASSMPLYSTRKPPTSPLRSPYPNRGQENRAKKQSLIISQLDLNQSMSYVQPSGITKKSADSKQQIVRVVAGTPHEFKENTVRDDSRATIVYSMNDQQAVLARLNEKYGDDFKVAELPSVCDFLGYPLCSFEINDARRILRPKANGKIMCVAAASWFSNIDKAFSEVTDFAQGVVGEHHRVMHPTDPAKLHHFIRELHSMRTQIDGEIGKLKLMEEVTSNQLGKGIDELDSIFENGYDLYEDLKNIDKILESNNDGLNKIILGTSGLTKILEGFLTK